MRKLTNTEGHHRRMQRHENTKPRRTKGQKSKNSKLAVVGTLDTLKRRASGLESPINTRIIATFTSHADLFRWLEHEAKKVGYGKKSTFFLADGSRSYLEPAAEALSERRGGIRLDRRFRKALERRAKYLSGKLQSTVHVSCRAVGPAAPRRGQPNA